MGGTQKDNFLNTVGQRKDGSGGQILMWKRKAEIYAMASGLDVTILHPGGLIDEPGGRKIVFGVDDTLLERKVSTACCIGGLEQFIRARNGLRTAIWR